MFYIDSSKTFIEDINPGNSLTGVLVSNVPKNTTVTEGERRWRLPGMRRTRC